VIDLFSTFVSQLETERHAHAKTAGIPAMHGATTDRRPASSRNATSRGARRASARPDRLRAAPLRTCS
jgi:hypothetical protein